MNVLVTGGAGYIGSHTCKELAKAGYAPIAYDDLSHGHRWAVKYGPLVEGSVADTARLAETLRLARPQAIVHFAAFTDVGESVRDPQTYFRNNVAGTISLLDAARAAGVPRIIFSSTCATYGQPQTDAIDEAHPRHPVSPYGASKAMAEEILRWNATAWPLRYVALRYFNAAGADPEGDLGEAHVPETHLIPRAIDAALRRGASLDIYGTDYPTPDGTAVRDYVHVTDLARAHVAALRYMDKGGTSDVFNIGAGAGVSVRQVIEAVEMATQRRVRRVEAPRRAGCPPVLVANPTKARAALRWSPRCSDIWTIVDTAVRWHNRQVLSGEVPLGAACGRAGSE